MPHLHFFGRVPYLKPAEKKSALVLTFLLEVLAIDRCCPFSKELRRPLRQHAGPISVLGASALLE